MKYLLIIIAAFFMAVSAQAQTDIRLGLPYAIPAGAYEHDYKLSSSIGIVEIEASTLLMNKLWLGITYGLTSYESDKQSWSEYIEYDPKPAQHNHINMFAAYRHNTDNPFSPYGGLLLGYGTFSHEADVDFLGGYTQKTENSDISVGLMAGTLYKITNVFNIDLRFRFQGYAGDLKGFSQIAIRLGAGYTILP
ncbi:MAG: outer membrane beta-barrel protein [Bacteroidota bacterium]